MPATYVTIASNVLNSSASSVTFSNIPNTYTDLVIRMSPRGQHASEFVNVYLRFNSNTNTLYSQNYLVSYTNQVSQGRSTDSTSTYSGDGSAASATSNTFGSIEFYIPSYTQSQDKPMSSFAASENNTTTYLTTSILVSANLFRSTSAISSIDIIADSTNFVSGSSFFLYGIKNS